MIRRASLLSAPLLLAACATQVPSAVNHAAATPGSSSAAGTASSSRSPGCCRCSCPRSLVYAVPNDGGWYDFGYFLELSSSASARASRRPSTSRGGRD
ncbi:hypothetical protein AB5I41_24370 [Sphingomonas sp. MMS24-JH45]